MEEDGSAEYLNFVQNLLSTGSADVNVDGGHLDNNAVSYVHVLLQGNVESLALEENRLAEKRKLLQEQKAGLVLENYAVLLKASAQLDGITSDLPDLKARLQNTLDRHGDTEEMGRVFESRVGDFLSQKGKFREQFSQLRNVEDLLELPVLLDSLAKNGLFEEAVDVIQYADKLSRQHPNSRALQLLREQSQKRAWMIMNILAAQLRTAPVQLLQVLKAVSLQRRLGNTLDIPVEEHVRKDFLQARSYFMGNVMKSVSQRDAFQFLSKIVEICRLHLFDTMNHYLSVFPDSPDVPPDLRVLPYHWLGQELMELTKVLEKHLPLVDDSRLESLLNQFNHLAEALSRFGTTMTAYFMGIFVSHVYGTFSRGLDDAIAEFRTSLRSGVKRKARPTTRIPASDDIPVTENSVTPPEELLDFPQLAILCNGFLGSFNRVRLCFVSALVVPVTFSINSALMEVAKLISSVDVQDARLRADIGDVFSTVFVPFVEKARDLLCPPEDAAGVLGVSFQQVRQMLAPLAGGIVNGFGGFVTVSDRKEMVNL